MGKGEPGVIMEEIIDPEELVKARAQRERFDRNFAWLQAHAAEIYSRYRGECICVAGEELFVAPTSEKALAIGQSARPDDDGSFVLSIPRERVIRVYGHLRRLAPG